MRRIGRGLLVLLLIPMSAASAETEPLDFVRIETQARGPDDFVWAAMARDRGELRRLWERYNQRGKLPVVRFKKNVAVLAGTGGSSSCPPRLHDLRLNRERKRVVVRLYESSGGGGACTGDWLPRTFTVAVARPDLRPFRPRRLSVRPRRIDDPNA